MAVDHYENFPVASLLLPRSLRSAVRAIYRFARSADDIADEGHAAPAARRAALARYRHQLLQIQANAQLAEDDPMWPVFGPLDSVIRRHDLPLEPFFDLLSAFEQDIETLRYADDTALLDYCSHSANPVGRLMLHLYGRATPQNIIQADQICTGLQLTNFWQDVAIDFQKGRVYLPQARLKQFGVGEASIANCETGNSWQALMRNQVQQARQLLLEGAPLARRLPARAGFELKLVVLGGLRILERLDQLHYDVFHHRPTLKKSDWILLVWRALH